MKVPLFFRAGRRLFLPWSRPWIWASLLSLALLSGCDQADDELSIELVSAPPEQASVEVAYPRILLPAGVVLAIEFRRQGGEDREFDEDTRFTVYSDNPQVARALQTDDNQQFLVVGKSPGQARFLINLGGENLTPIEVQVNKPRSEKKDKGR